MDDFNQQLQTPRLDTEEVRRTLSAQIQTAESKADFYKYSLGAALAILALVAFEKNKPHDEWLPDVGTKQILCCQHGWFSSRLVALTWRKDFEGQWTWCYEGRDGNWHAYKYQP